MSADIYMIVDDAVPIQRLMKWNIQKLCGRECDIKLLGDGEEAIDIFQGITNSGRHNDIVLILMDTHMPRCGGVEAIQRIREIEVINNELYPVVISGFSADISDEMKVQYFSCGANYVLEKPPLPGAFEYMIGQILNSRGNR